MVVLDNQRALNARHRRGYCYLCGKPFEREDITKDHAPPINLFDQNDRQNVVILPAHFKCNQAASFDDERSIQLLTPYLWGNSISKDRLRLNYRAVHDENTQRNIGGIRGAELYRAIYRWIQGFHCLLYDEFLPPHPVTKHAISCPLYRGVEQEDEMKMHGPQPAHRVMVRQLRINRLASRVDRIEAYNGKLKYECCWVRMDDGSPACLWGMQIYDWEKLTPQEFFPKHGCVGFYLSSNGKPVRAEWSTSVEYDHSLDDLLPFDSAESPATAPQNPTD